MAQDITTVKINELATSAINSSDYFVKADANGIAYKNTLSALANFIGSVGVLGYKGALAIADTPTDDGFYFASESGTYTNAGGLVADLSAGLNMISVEDGQSEFNLIVIPIDLSSQLVSSVDFDITDKGVTSQGVYLDQDRQNRVIDGISEERERTMFVPNYGQDSYLTADGLGAISSSGWVRMSLSNTNEMHPIRTQGKYYYSGEIVSATNVAGVVFVDENLNFISSDITSVGVYADEYLNIPPGARFILACSYGSNPVIKEVLSISDSYGKSIQFPLEAVPLTYVNDEFIRNTTGQAESNTSYHRTESIQISSLPSNVLSVDVGTRGGSIAAVAYYSSAAIGSGSYVGFQDVGAVNENENAVQLLNLKLAIPDGATHLALCSYKGFELNLYSALNFPQNTVQVIESESPVNTSAIAYNQLNDNPFGFEATTLQKRGAILGNLSGANVVPLIIIAGQSNADGRVPYSSAPSWFTDTNGKINDFMMWNKGNNTFQSYESGVNTGAENNQDTRYSFDIHFAKNYIDNNPGKKLYAIKQTLGGTAIYEGGATESGRWQPKTELIQAGERHMVTELLNKFKLAISYAQQNNIVFQFVGVLWHQGERDSNLGQIAVDNYQQNLSNLISWMRGVMMSPKSPFINADIVPSQNALAPDINTIFDTLNGIDEYMKTVDMSGNYTTLDGVHYDAPAIEYMGNQMYQMYKIYNPTY